MVFIYWPGIGAYLGKQNLGSNGRRILPALERTRSVQQKWEAVGLILPVLGQLSILRNWASDRFPKQWELTVEPWQGTNSILCP